LRMKHRYLEMRNSHLQQALRLRSDFLCDVRHLLTKSFGFVEVETPTLFKRTPGGAQEFCVPTRHRNRFYSLVQSPQQFKQMLMIGGIDRYFQIARCYRDETSRADRQPEFTQIDLELSFTNPNDIQQLVEQILIQCWPAELFPIQVPFRRMTYDKAMENYGTDQPDCRLNMKIQSLSLDSNQERFTRAFTFKVSNIFDLEQSEVQQLIEVSNRLLRQFNLENKAQLQAYIKSGDQLMNLDRDNLAKFDVQAIASNEMKVKEHLSQAESNGSLDCVVIGKAQTAVSELMNKSLDILI
jgi:aspartyl-tRNA synthetase